MDINMRVSGTHKKPNKGAHVRMQLCKGSRAGVGSQVDMHTCTDACTHPNQGVWPAEGWLEHACRATQGCTCLHATI